MGEGNTSAGLSEEWLFLWIRNRSQGEDGEPGLWYLRQETHSYSNCSPLTILIYDGDEFSLATTEIFKRPIQIVIEVRIGKDPVALVHANLRDCILTCFGTYVSKYGIHYFTQCDPPRMTSNIEKRVATYPALAVGRLWATRL
jgi:hypothetical protein